MAIFGLPRALAGDVWWTDARVWFALVTVAALVGAMRVLRGAGSPAFVRAVQSTTRTADLCSDPGHRRRRPAGPGAVPAGAGVLCGGSVRRPRVSRSGAAAALKLFAFPVVVVLAVLALVTGNGRRFLPGALGLPVLVLVPPLLVDPDAFVENVIRFPLGHGLVTSPAQSPFPGYLISSAVPGGRYRRGRAAGRGRQRRSPSGCCAVRRARPRRPL